MLNVGFVRPISLALKTGSGFGNPGPFGSVGAHAVINANKGKQAIRLYIVSKFLQTQADRRVSNAPAHHFDTRPFGGGYPLLISHSAAAMFPSEAACLQRFTA